MGAGHTRRYMSMATQRLHMFDVSELFVFLLQCGRRRFATAFYIKVRWRTIIMICQATDMICSRNSIHIDPSKADWSSSPGDYPASPYTLTRCWSDFLRAFNPGTSTSINLYNVPTPIGVPSPELCFTSRAISSAAIWITVRQTRSIDDSSASI